MVLQRLNEYQSLHYLEISVSTWLSWKCLYCTSEVTLVIWAASKGLLDRVRTPAKLTMRRNCGTLSSGSCRGRMEGMEASHITTGPPIYPKCVVLSSGVICWIRGVVPGAGDFKGNQKKSTKVGVCKYFSNLFHCACAHICMQCPWRMSDILVLELQVVVRQPTWMLGLNSGTLRD